MGLNNKKLKKRNCITNKINSNRIGIHGTFAGRLNFVIKYILSLSLLIYYLHNISKTVFNVSSKDILLMFFKYSD